jgi:5-methyltetrahydropteroyltriglutamate--homocysteine methyltransferase
MMLSLRKDVIREGFAMPSSDDRSPFRADHVGSLIRPKKLIEAHAAHDRGQFPADELRALEDVAIRDAVAMQERVGLRAVTDGEMRRNNWRDRFFERVDGFSAERIPSSFFFTEFNGERRRGMPVPTVVAKLKRRETLTAADFAAFKPLTRQTAKATLPSPSANHFFSGDKSMRGSPYHDRDAFLADVCAIYRQEVADLAAMGCTYLQIDEVPIAVLCDPINQELVRSRGEDPDELIGDYVAAINGAVRDRPKTMTVCVHLCRGNGGHGQASGGYDPVAERLFGELDVDGFFLEYDTARSGTFEPLRVVPKGKKVVLGIISTKLAALEPEDEVKRRIDEAGHALDLDQLCLSPQCGFASSFVTDRFTLDDQERKLAHIVKIARAVWGTA